MKNKKIENSKIGTFLRENKEMSFCGMSAISAILIGGLMWCNTMIFTMAVISSLVLYWRLPLAFVQICDRMVRLGWAFINFALFVAVCKIGSIEAMCGTVFAGSYVLGGLCVVFISIPLYKTIIPQLSHKMRFIKEEYGWDDDGNRTKNNGGLGAFALHVLMFFIIVGVFEHKRNNALFAEEKFVDVISWEKEMYSGSTIYIVETEKGTFGIRPQKYPEIRKIHADTKIRVLAKKRTFSGLTEFVRLEIKN